MNRKKGPITGFLPIFSFALLLRFSVPAEAARGCSGEANWRISGAASCLERKDVGCAKLKLEPVLANEPKCGAGLFVHGWIVQYFDGRVKEGQALQDRAMELDPKLKTFWEDRGHAIEAQSSKQSFSHFDVQFYGAENRDKAWEAVKYLNEMYIDLGSLFGVYPPRRIPVIIFTTSEFMAAWRAPFVGGFFDKRDGKIRIRVDEVPGGAKEFQLRARHEMTHAFVHQLYPRTIPSWAQEGIAEFCARQGLSGGFWKDERLEAIRKMRKGLPWLSLTQIEQILNSRSGTVLQAHIAYLESEALVLWIARDRGESWVPRVLKHLTDKGGTFEEAYQALYGVDVEREMERLKRYWE